MSAAPSKLGGLTRVRRSESTIRICRRRRGLAKAISTPIFSDSSWIESRPRPVAAGEAHLVSGLQGDGTLTAFLLDDPSCDVSLLLVRDPDPVWRRNRVV